MSIRKFLIPGLVLLLAACSSDEGMESTDTMGQGEMVTEGPLMPGQAGYGADAYGNANGVVPGSQQDLVVNIGDRVFFGFDRYDLTPEGQETLKLQAEWMKQYPNVRVSIQGHCDERGTREYNLALGERRAASVKNLLMSLGVDSSRISTISYGKEMPAVLGSNPSAWAQNRRGVTVVE